MYSRMHARQGLSGLLDDLSRSYWRTVCAIPASIGIVGTKGSICRTVLEHEDLTAANIPPPPAIVSGAPPPTPGQVAPPTASGPCNPGESSADCLARVRLELEQAAARQQTEGELRLLEFTRGVDERNRMAACISGGGTWNREASACTEEERPIAGLTWVALAVGGALLVAQLRGGR